MDIRVFPDEAEKRRGSWSRLKPRFNFCPWTRLKPRFNFYSHLRRRWVGPHACEPITIGRLRRTTQSGETLKPVDPRVPPSAPNLRLPLSHVWTSTGNRVCRARGTFCTTTLRLPKDPIFPVQGSLRGGSSVSLGRRTSLPESRSTSGAGPHS